MAHPQDWAELRHGMTLRAPRSARFPLLQLLPRGAADPWGQDSEAEGARPPRRGFRPSGSEF